MESPNDEELIDALCMRLYTSGPQPKRERVAAALAMARDPGLMASKACDDAGVPMGGARTRVAEYHKCPSRCVSRSTDLVLRTLYWMILRDDVLLFCLNPRVYDV